MQQAFRFNPYKSDDPSQVEHEMVLSALKNLLGNSDGQILLKYLFKHFGIAEVPTMGLKEDLLYDQIGFLRAGTSLFDLSAQADPKTTGQLLAEIYKEKNNV